MLATIATAETLRELADSLGVYVGSAINMYHKDDDDRYDKYFKAENNIAVAEYECKMKEIRKNKNKWDFTRCVYAFEYAIDNGMEFRGHALVFGATNKINPVPDWIKWETNANTLNRELKEFIQRTMRDVKSLAKDGSHNIYAWDVVNESVADCHESEYLLKPVRPWYRTGGNDMTHIDNSFRWAAEADPDTLLFYNDYGPSYSTCKNQRTIEMIKGMQDRGVPIHGMGI
jgi:endo-1,4-beta-xylanase